MANKVIVFGPTGSVGHWAALTAQEHGAKVFLAMRDTSKAIPDLNPAAEKAGGFERVQADLSKPETISAAIKKTGASSAFMYLNWQAKDHMKATFSAAKEAGIEFLVFLSSFTIVQPLAEVPSSRTIPYSHARAEMTLGEVFGPKNYVALRVGFFATNAKGWLREHEHELTDYKSKADWVTPYDMGRVGGTILAQGQRDGQNVVYVYGKELLTLGEGAGIIGEVIGKKVVWDEKEKTNDGKTVLVRRGADSHRAPNLAEAYANWEDGSKNVLKYTGKPPLSLREWVERNRELYGGHS